MSSVSLSLDAAGQTLAPLLVNQLVAIPALYWPSFFLFAALAEGRSAQTALQTLHRKLPGLMKANLAFWIPAQGFQFSHVPAEQQAVYVACAGVVWNGILATITAPKAADEERGKKRPKRNRPTPPRRVVYSVVFSGAARGVDASRGGRRARIYDI